MKNERGNNSDPQKVSASVKKRITVALAGNPNAGKTTIFNALTGSNQHVGNYPGVTVEKKSGKRIFGDHEITFVDLPGTYSLSAYSLEERIARDFIVNEKPDVVIDVIDSSNLERNLYLASQILELNAPMVIALNMFDEVKKEGTKIDIDLLGTLLGAPVVPTIGSQEKGIDELLKTVIDVTKGYKKRDINVNYGLEMEKAISEIVQMLDDVNTLENYPKRWIALKLLEDDEEIKSLVGENHPSVEKAKSLAVSIEKLIGDEPSMVIADQRYGFVSGICRETIHTRPRTSKDITEQLDTVLANRVLGFPIFLLLMWLSFQMTFRVGAYPMNWIDSAFGMLSNFLANVLPQGWFSSLLIDGVIAGVGGVVVFLPNILLLFLAIALLEDTGYMARAAFIMDRVMHAIGLHGKSFVPMLIGFGCSVPAIMATRTLENPKDRLTTMLVVPLMSCGARLPIYILLAGTFFPSNAGNIIFLIYLLGVFLAVVMALIFKRFLFHGPSTPFVMELPPYRLPTLKSVLLHMWRRAYFYLHKAATIILAASVIIWILMNLNIGSTSSSVTTNPDDSSQDVTNRDDVKTMEISNSIAGTIGKIIEPTIKPLGFDWRIAIALLGGFAGKEIVVATLGTVYAVGETHETSPELRKALMDDPAFTPLVALCLMVFVLIYVPCIAAISVLYRESGSAKWSTFAVVYTISLAWIVTFIVRQIGIVAGLS